MPQKTIFSKYPLLSLPCSFLSCGLIRTEEQNVCRLYSSLQPYLDNPLIWEGAFRLAAMVTKNPLSEAVAGRILTALDGNEDGSFGGNVKIQIAVARAAMAVFEYNTDRGILKRIASWCRFLEIEWDQLLTAGEVVFRPADLMELLVCFYRISGIKSVLRLCAKLRSTAFDWTTSLHTIQQVIPLDANDDAPISFITRSAKEEIDYDQKQALLCHAEMLADGIRYSLYSGIFSGNRQDLTAGKAAWNLLQKHYRAVCGGTTAGPFLCGNAADSRISTQAVAAWTEAFASQLLLPESEWAADELIRIVCNGLAYCLNADTLPSFQQVNSISGVNEPAYLPDCFVRIARAAAAAFRSAVTVTEKGIRINCLLPARYLAMVRKQPLLVTLDEDSVHLNSRSAQPVPVELFRARTDTAAAYVKHEDGSSTSVVGTEGMNATGEYLRMEVMPVSDWILFEYTDRVVCEKAHHQGVCCFVRNRLMVYECDHETFAVALSELPKASGGQVEAFLCPIEGWNLRYGEADDIPVLPSYFGEPVKRVLTPYGCKIRKISLFPRINPLCLK